ncbi:cysteine protease StiP family protein [Paenibacillus sp. P96]|uniref:Cysteine protease StiP family protein n=1 Tax=Paenibacillus zeirhizosphaerae TaxID=2987519 RepID=A0ABT9FTN0_9BACL|nr:cysteine protease StiP family protein [Paenibacillus sp. P96]MDP4098056.1 cysteine protease StiP family protein [Paenibacillus sp. P96]
MIPDTRLMSPPLIGSYKAEDVVFLLKDISDAKLEVPTEDREEAIQAGRHYSEMLPVEYQPTQDYLDLFHRTLQSSAKKVALAAGVVAELIIKKRGCNVVLASLARAGTPIGILIKRYVEKTYGITLPHYSISIIRGKGIDENAILYMLQNHPSSEIQFVDGWTGKGAIRKVLIEASKIFHEKHHVLLNDDLAVLADPGHCSQTFGTREDFLIPSAALNSTVSGLVSRTVLRPDLIGPNDFHGAKFYREWLAEDVSNVFVDQVSAHFDEIMDQAKLQAEQLYLHPEEESWKGMQDITRIQNDFEIRDVNLVKPGVGETTRVLLRRVPWKILVDREDNPNLEHIRLLVKDRNVPIEVYPDLSYSCCGIIRPAKGEKS